MYEYPFGNGQQLNLDWFLAEWKNLLAAWEAEKNGIAGALDAEIAKAEAALADVFAARDAAAQSAANALESKNAAAQSASDASGYLSTVQQNATAAQDAARNAAQSESNAADSAQTAVASKNAAGQSERNAAQSEANALASKDAAAQSASNADASKSAAAQSAADADASKSAAAQSAEDAENAANSVEASAQQIATNTSDINTIKQSLNENNLSAYEFLTQKYFLSNVAKLERDGRSININKNLITLNYVAIGTPSQGNCTVLTGTPRTVKALNTEYTPIIEDLTKLPNNIPSALQLYSFFKAKALPASVTGVIIKLCTIDGEIVTVVRSYEIAYYTGTPYPLNSRILNLSDITHIAIVFYTRTMNQAELYNGYQALIELRFAPSTQLNALSLEKKDNFYEALEETE